MRHAPKREHGFTLIEITMALVIFAIVMGLAFTAFRSVILPQRAQSAAREIGSLLRTAQQAATANAAGYRCVGLAITATSAAVRAIPTSDTTTDCANPTAGAFAAAGTVLLQGSSYPTGVTVTVTPGSDTGVVTYLPTGATCTGSNCATSVTVVGGASTRRVCIAAGTGLVQVVENVSCP
jgi:prepilin-type N-terminal cleavage/methylation domain-containing protein